MKSIKFQSLYFSIGFIFIILITIPGCDSSKKVKGTFNLAYEMSFMQRYAEKIYFAALNENWDLADFYNKELSETSEVILASQYVTEEGINTSQLIQVMFIPKLSGIKRAVAEKNKTSFMENYNVLIEACNSCHTSAGRSFIHIITPTDLTYKNQKFSK